MFILLIWLILVIHAQFVFADTYSEEFLLQGHQSLYIIDGDSANIKMRIEGIDTPELGQSCEKRVGIVLDCGVLSKAHLSFLLRETSGALSVQLLGFDVYSRALVHITKGGVDIGAKMVADGMAFSYDRYFLEEKKARANVRGFWNFYKPPIKPKDWRKQHYQRK